MLRLRSTAILLLAIAAVTVIATQDEPVPTTTAYTPTGKLSQFRGFVTPRPTGQLPSNANFMYASVWAAWSAWSFCVNGNRIRVRACNTVRGFSCMGTNREMQPCEANAPNMNTHNRRRFHSDYDVVDPYEQDRREAMNQLYPDDDAELAAQQQKPSGNKANFAKIGDDFKSRAAGVQTASKLSTGSEGVGSGARLKRQAMVSEEDEEPEEKEDSVFLMERIARKARDDAIRRAELRREEGSIVRRAYAYASKLHSPYMRPIEVVPSTEDRFLVKARRSRHKILNDDKETTTLVENSHAQGKSTENDHMFDWTENPDYDWDMLSERYLQEQMRVGRENLWKKEEVRKQKRPLQGFTDVIIPVPEVAYEEEEKEDQVEDDVTVVRDHDYIEDGHGDALEISTHQKELANKKNDNSDEVPVLMESTDERESETLNQETLQYDWTETPEYDQDILRQLRTA